jgi:IMP dehydrogenase
MVEDEKTAFKAVDNDASRNELILSMQPEITFDDILLLPGRSAFGLVESTTKISLKSRISRTVTLDAPIMAAPMPSIAESAMAVALAAAGGIAVLHPFQSLQAQLEQVRDVKKRGLKVAAGVIRLGDEGIKHVGRLLDSGCDLISVEALNVHCDPVLRFIERLKSVYKSIDISVGVLVTPEATEDAISAGADSIRVGIGGGSHCTTRLVTGVGRPQLSTVSACYAATRKHNIPLISDTGIKYSGDIPKALAFGADAVMIGGLLAGTDECPGKVVTRRGAKYKSSIGMCTSSAATLLQGKTSAKQKAAEGFVEEGVGGLIPYRGSVKPVLQQLVAGTRRSFWYQGVVDIADLRKKARAVLASHSTSLENVSRI